MKTRILGMIIMMLGIGCSIHEAAGAGGLYAGTAKVDITPDDAFISAKAKDPKACQALLDYLNSPEAEAIYKAHGIAPVK